MVPVHSMHPLTPQLLVQLLLVESRVKLVLHCPQTLADEQLAQFVTVQLSVQVVTPLTVSRTKSVSQAVQVRDTLLLLHVAQPMTPQ